MNAANGRFDLAVIGGGLGGLATAALAQRLGLRVVLCESHTKLGGCAGWFARGPFTFDAGATALVGLEPGRPLGDLIATLGIDFDAAETPSYRVVMPDRTLEITSNPDDFEAAVASAFPGATTAKRRFLRLQAAVGRTLLDVAGGLPRLPQRSASDVLHNLRVLGPRGLAAACTSMLTVDDVLRGFGLRDDRPFRTLVAMLLQDTAQAGPETVPFANAAACLHAYRIGMRRPRSGMRALVEGVGSRFASLGGDLRLATKVDHVERLDGDEAHFAVITRRRERVLADQVAFNLPLDLAAALLGKSLKGRLGRREQRSRAAWSACTAYLAFDRETVDDDAPLFHHVLQNYDQPIHDGNNVLISLSNAGDLGYAPAHLRVATLSTHTRPADWADLDRDAHAKLKSVYANRLLTAFRRALPEAADNLKHSEFGTPNSFRRYTRRIGGAVGGPPVARRNSNLLAVGSDVLGPGLWVVGDSVFPGQGTLAVVLSAIRLVERLTGIPRPHQLGPTPARTSDPTPATACQSG